jgi:hypothetical protein
MALQPAEAEHAFSKFLTARNQRVADLSVRDGIDAMLAFYEQVRADGCDLEADGDMLLYQWGIFDFGNGSHFELDLTRQFVLGEGEDDDIWQLSLTFLFAPSPVLAALGSGDQWCHAPTGSAELRGFIHSSSAYAVASMLPMLRVELDVGQV